MGVWLLRRCFLSLTFVVVLHALPHVAGHRVSRREGRRSGASGLIAEYWDNTAVGTGSDNPTCNRTDPNINFVWAASSPGSARRPSSPVCGSVQSQAFSARWRGQILSATNDTYSFSVYTNGGVRLWVGDHLLVDQWCTTATCWQQSPFPYVNLKRRIMSSKHSSARHPDFSFSLGNNTNDETHGSSKVDDEQAESEDSEDAEDTVPKIRFRGGVPDPVMVNAFVNMTMEAGKLYNFRLEFYYVESQGSLKYAFPEGFQSPFPPEMVVGAPHQATTAGAASGNDSSAVAIQQQKPRDATVRKNQRVRARMLDDDSSSSASSGASSNSIYAELYWQSTSMTQAEIVPGSALLPQVTAEETERQALRDRQAQGWGTWYNHNMMAQVKLPESLALSLGLYQKSTNTFFTDIIVFGQHNPPVRVGHHAWDMSFWELSILWQGLNITVTGAKATPDEHATTDEDALLLITAKPANASEVSPSAPTDDIFLILLPSMLFNRSGTITINYTEPQTLPAAHAPSVESASSVFSWFFGSDNAVQDAKAVTGTASITAQFPGYQDINAYSTAPGISDPTWKIPGPFVGFSLASGPVGISTGSNRSVEEIQKLTDTARTSVEGLKTAYGDRADLYDAMQSVIAWNTIFTPYEGVVTPVSRGWDFGRGYVLFDWDNYFCSYMAAFDNKDLAYSNIIQLTKSKTMNGFVPNYASGPIASRDRTEPMVGALMLQRIYSLYQEDWLVELLFDDLMDWNDWVWNFRRHPPLGLVVLGTDPNQPIQSDQVDQMQGARWESGLDNSPLYDQPPVNFDNVSHHMLLYDVGMTSFFLSECQALIALADVVQDPVAKATVQDRYNTMSALVQKFLWDDTRGIYVNRMTDTGSAIPNLAPTSFFPMMSGTATIDQAETMVKLHLTNNSEFCVSADCPGMAVPSISRNDPAFGDNDYWRGRVWGPHNLLVYLGLSHPAYNQSTIVTGARQQLVKQAANMMLMEWYQFHHVHENYNGTSGVGCDVSSSDPFYHWGALNGYLTFIEYDKAMPHKPEP